MVLDEGTHSARLVRVCAVRKWTAASSEAPDLPDGARASDLPKRVRDDTVGEVRPDAGGRREPRRRRHRQTHARFPGQARQKLPRRRQAAVLVLPRSELASQRGTRQLPDPAGRDKPLHRLRRDLTYANLHDHRTRMESHLEANACRQWHFGLLARTLNRYGASADRWVRR